MTLDEPTLKALLGIGSAIAGGVFGAILSNIKARQQVRELELKHAHQLRGEYLENARQYTSDLYVPLAVALSRLREGFYSFRNELSADRAYEEPEAERLRASISEFSDLVDSLLSRGGSAFLTNELDNLLISFRTFLGLSVYSKKESVKVVFTFSLGFPGLVGWRGRRKYELSGRAAERWSRTIRYREPVVLDINWQPEVQEAPLHSKLFEQRFVRDVFLLNSLVKEVTLGSRANPIK